MNILITGAAGLIGSCLTHYINDNYPEHFVIGTDNLSGGYRTNLPEDNERFKFYKIDTEDDNLKTIFEQYYPDIVYHMSAYAAEGLSPFLRKYTIISNNFATANVINCCINYDVKRLIYTSSMAVYGDGIIGERFDETLTPAPLDPYAISKYASELDILCANRIQDLEYCIIRPHNVYGIRQNIYDTYRNVLAIWMMQFKNNEPMIIYGDGLQTRAFSYVDDMLEPLYKAGTSDKAKNQIINLGSSEQVTIKDACLTLCDILSNYGNPVYEHKEARYEVKHAIPTHEKSVELLDYKDTVSLKEGLRKMWFWVKDLPKEGRFHWPKYEIEKGLYSYWK